jgi:hypothetical protein
MKRLTHSRTGAESRHAIPRTAGLAALLCFGAVSQAQAGCGLSITFDNNLNSSITVLEVEAKPTGGTYATVFANDFTVGSGNKVTKAIETTIGCAAPHNLRVKYKKGGNTLYKSKGPIVTAVDKKINFDFDD